MKVSILVPAFNEEKLITATLEHIGRARAAFAGLNWDSEVCVCDNNSTDQTARLAREASARVVFEPVNQIGRARNAAAKISTGEWLVFVDADSQPSHGLFAELAQVIHGGRHLGGGSTVRLDQAPFWAGLVLLGWNCTSRLMRWAAGSFLFVRAEAFREVGGFDERLFASEEIDLSIRLNRLARARGLRRLAILHRHPLLTSARKVHLYSPLEHARFLVATVLSGGRTLRRRESCGVWYDGRR